VYRSVEPTKYSNIIQRLLSKYRELRLYIRRPLILDLLTLLALVGLSRNKLYYGYCASVHTGIPSLSKND
jgi:hypothetical protein